MSAILRFAPSPNGLLHLGHAYSALLNRQIADRLGGRLLLRIEDIDPARSKPAFERALRDELAWLGIGFDGPVRRQSEHVATYVEAADRLRAGGLLYPCICTRGDIARAVRSSPFAPRLDPDGAPHYPGTCRGRDVARFGMPTAWRLDMVRALAALDAPLAFEASRGGGPVEIRPADPARWGDPVVVRKDTPTSYHLSVVVDDAVQDVTLVVRGRDLETATDLHVLLQRLLGLPTPRYRHHRLLRGPGGAKLSKSLASPSLASLRQAGTTPAQVRERLGFVA